MENQKFFYHWIPKASSIQTKKENQTPLKDPWVIGVIDSSGSMSGWWKHVAENYNALVDSLATKKIITYCFSDKIYAEPNIRLKDSISQYGSSMTNIFLAFQHLETEMQKIPDDEEIKVIFVSDGQDTCNGNLEVLLRGLQGAMNKKISFMCLGVQSGFPTFLSLNLREKYHRGDPTIPSIFLIEYASDKAFFNKFQSIKPYFKAKEEIRIEPHQKLFPWEDFVKTVAEEQWIMSRDKSITLQGDVDFEYKDDNFSIESVSEVFRSWSQKLQLDSVNKKLTAPQAKEFASAAYHLMMEILDDVKIVKGIDILNAGLSDKDSFENTVLNHQMKLGKERIRGYLTAVEEIMNGKDLTSLGEYEAAKIIGLGTIVGKRQQRVLALNNLTKDSFDRMIDEFKTTIASIQLADTTALPESHTSKLNLFKLLKDTTLLRGLSKIPSVIDLAELFPFIGIPVTLKRTEGSQSDPWKVNVKSYYTKEGDFDSREIDFLTRKLNTKLEGEDVEINCIVPLLSSQDAYLAPIFYTEVYRYLSSYYVTEEFDQIYNDALIPVFGDMFALAVKAGDNATVERIAETLKALRQTGVYKEIFDGIEICDDNAYLKMKSLSTCIMFHYVHAQLSEDLEGDEREEIAQKVWIAYFNERLSTSKNGIIDFVQSGADGDVKSLLLAKYNPRYILETFYTSKELVRHIKNNCNKEIAELKGKSNSKGLQIIQSAFTADINSLVNLNVVTSVIKSIGGKVLTDDWKFLFLAHSIDKLGINSPISEDIEQAKIKLASKIASKSDKTLGKRITFQLMDKLQRDYFDAFKTVHWNIKPLSWEEIKAHCEANHKDISKLNFNPERKIVLNACMAPECPHFLKYNPKRLRNHLGGWQTELPKGFHLYVYEHKDKSEEEIYDEFVKERKIKDIAAYNTTKEKVLDYIKTIRSAL